ncbi:hypothetical protein BU17DRAFT_38905 [Hysterangium stoloniferum]|nr:hypothetical protein BU17DRAFT_38905 [Hysterangium stoloniferum]
MANRQQRLASASPDLFGNDGSEILEALGQVESQAGPQTQLSSSSDLFGTEDAAFLQALAETPLVDEQSITPLRITQPELEYVTDEQEGNRDDHKRKRSGSPEPFEGGEPSYTDSDIYNASKFHGFGEYMQHKRAKLAIQNDEVEDSLGGKKSDIFKGLALHVNGKTNPSVQELRKLIVQHGGTFHPYLDRKKMITHIIATNLTPSKVLEFKNMKVVTPEWLLESVKARVLLSWKEFIIGAGGRSDESQGKTQPGKLNSQNIMNNASISGNSSVSNTDIPGRMPSGVPSKSNSIPSELSATARPLHGADFATKEGAFQIPSYAPHVSNPCAQRKIGDPKWRAENTAIAPGFIAGFYQNSRLHHLSTWKSELQDLVSQAIENVENGHAAVQDTDDSLKYLPDGTSMAGIQFRRPASPQKGKAVVRDNLTIMHCDFDAFFVSAGLVDRPRLKGKAVVVCHSHGGRGGVASTSEIASSSYEARKYGIKNGMSLGQAKKLCSDLQTIPYEFEKYKRFSLQFYTILMSYADDLQAVSVDEALINVSTTVENARRMAHIGENEEHPDYAKELAEIIRARVRNATGCEVSIGISHNILLARLATRRAKPAGSYHILPEGVSDILAPLDIEDIRGFGWSIRSKVAAKFGVTTLGELGKRPKAVLMNALGNKTGETLWKAIRGIDDTKIESNRIRKSVSCEINYGIRFISNEEAETFIAGVAKEVSERLNKLNMCGRSLTLKIMMRDPKAPVEAPKFLGHGVCDTMNKTSPLVGPSGRATADPAVIGSCAWKLLKGLHIDPKELRGIGIHVQKLEKANDVGSAPVSGGQGILPFEKSDTFRPPQRQRPVGVVEPPALNAADKEAPPISIHNQPLRPQTVDVLPSFSQVDQTFLDALPSDIRAELEQEYGKSIPAQAIAGPSRHASALTKTRMKSPNKMQEPFADLARITKQLAPRSRPSVSPDKRLHPLFSKRVVSNGPKVSSGELKLLDIDAAVWAELPVSVQREQLAALRAANVGTGMAIRASMSTQAKQERILQRWRKHRHSPSVALRSRGGLEILAKPVELPSLKQRGKNKRDELKVSDTEDIQAVISQWVDGFEDDGPRQGDVEYFGKFLSRCVETDMGTERGLSALKWWLILLQQRWGNIAEQGEEGAHLPGPGRSWWNAFWEVKMRMDGVVNKRFGGTISLK